MSEELLSADGLVVPATALELPRARALATFASGGATPFVRLVECRRQSGVAGTGAAETVVFDVDVERPQRPTHDIRRIERVAAVFHAEDTRYPEVLALRADFPSVPHLNHTLREFPRSLCLYDRAWAEVAFRWTAAAFVERIRDWLRLTAKGLLHQDDQPLEQLLFGGGLRLILPADVLSDFKNAAPLRLDVFRLGSADRIRNILAQKPTNDPRDQGGLHFVATSFPADPQTHGIIRRSPATIAELHDLLAAGGIDLIGELRKRIFDWEQGLRAKQLVIIVAFPLRRSDEDAAERWDFWAFLTLKTVLETGIGIGLWEKANGTVGKPLFLDDTLRGQDIPIDVVSPYVEFSRTAAAAANGVEPDSVQVVAVGAGALGSQVIATLARSGFGRWTVVDEDDLLPHNLARHAFTREEVGHAKAHGMARYLNMLYEDGPAAEGIAADVLSPAEKTALLTEKYSQAEVILDVAASVPVARHLALGVSSSARRVSVFLNPHGTDVVVLAEDKARSMTLDVLEAQYYRAAAADARLAGHLAANPGRLRYGRTCRDVTFSMPSHLVTIHAGIAAQAVKRALASDDASVRIWRCDQETMAVTPVEVQLGGMLKQSVSGWTLVLDDGLRARLAEQRASRLPNETGGVLIGMYDLTRRIVYVVDTVPSPPDSVEWPTLYIRGSQGLLEEVQEIGSRSGGQLEYVGEWHSHPDGCRTLPSSDDVQVFMWLTERMDEAGLPALMAIVGEQNGSSWYLGSISPGVEWLVWPDN